MEEPKKIKIAEVITRLDHGGAPEVLLSIIENFDLASYEPVLVFGLTQDPVISFEKIKGMRIRQVRINSLRREFNPLFDVLAFIQLYRLFKKEKFDIVHTHTSKAGAIGRLAARLAGVKVIIHTTHGHVFYGYFGPLFTKLIILAEKALANFCDVITVLTEKEKEDYFRYKVAGEDKITVIFNGVDLSKFFGEAKNGQKLKADLGLPANLAIVGLVSRLDPVKGPLDFIRAAKKVCDRDAGVRFLVIGEGELRMEMESLAVELGVFDKVVFAGFREDVPEILKVIDILVQPSLNEGFGLSIVEAQASGKPVIATRVGGVPEVVLEGESGVLVAPQDPEALAKAIENLLSDKATASRMGEKGRRFVESRFSIKACVDKYISLYNELYGRKSKKS